MSRWILLACLLAACDGGSTPDAGAALPDAGFDAGFADAAVGLDAGLDAGIDAGRDAGAPDAGSDGGADGPIGALSGACGEIDDELTSAMPFVLEAAYDFGDTPLMEMDLDRLSAGAREILDEGTLGGSSVYSEAIAFEVLSRCEGATLLQSESEIVYTDPMGTLTDMRVEIDGMPVGVSVVRAVGFPRDAAYPVSMATPLLTRKLEDIQESSANVSDVNPWGKQILVVVAYSPMHGESMRTAWETLDDAVRADTIVLITVTNGEDEFIYDDRL